MDHLYSRLDGLYPQKWRANFNGPESIENWSVVWAEAFEEEGIQPANVRLGLKACRTKFDWPPSCAEFIKACKPAVDPTVAYYEACAGIAARSKGDIGKWSHPGVYWAAIGMAYDLGTQTYSQVKGRWEQSLADQLDKGEWPAIPEPVIALPAPGRADLSKEKAGQMLQELGAAGVLKLKRDAKHWAKRILADEKSKAGSWPHYSVRCAEEAMGAGK